MDSVVDSVNEHEGRKFSKRGKPMHRLTATFAACLIAVSFILASPCQGQLWGSRPGGSIPESAWNLNPAPGLRPSLDNKYWTYDPFAQVPRPTLNNPYWTWDPFSKRARPTLNNPGWTWDPFAQTPKPTVTNPHWRWDPFANQARPTLNNRGWSSDPFTGTPRPSLGNPSWSVDPFHNFGRSRR